MGEGDRGGCRSRGGRGGNQWREEGSCLGSSVVFFLK